MPARFRHFLLALAACATLCALLHRVQKPAPAYARLESHLSGSFAEGIGSWFGEGPTAIARGLRAWGSWSGYDDRTGRLELGPFAAPRQLRLGVSGYPDKPGNAVALEHAVSRERHPLNLPAIGERWLLTEHVLPPAWEGQPVRLIVVDEATGYGGWLAVTEPLRGARGNGSNAFLESLTAWSLTGLFFGLLFFAAARLVAARDVVAPHWQPLAAGALMGLAAYAAYWVWLASPKLGAYWCGALLLAAGAALLRRPRADAPELRSVVTLIAGIGAFYLALLHLFPTTHDFYTLAANRYREHLPTDNVVTHHSAERVAGRHPLTLAHELWRFTDSGPVQIGWQLLVRPIGGFAGLDATTFSGTAAWWLQLLWIAAAYGVLRALAVEVRRASGWVAAIALAGFLVQHTAYTSARLAAAPFVLGAAAALLLPGFAATSQARALWAAIFGALAWLTHVSALHSLLPLALWALWRGWCTSFRPGGAGLALLLGLLLPWLIYTQAIHPPTQVLLKEHLAGDIAPAGQGLWETIRANYSRIGWSQAVANKISNIRMLFAGDWHSLVEISRTGAQQRANDEFLHTARGLAWWPALALVAGAIAGWRTVSMAGDLARFAAWLLASLVVWCAVMFGHESTASHHGSFGLMLGLFLLFSVALERFGRAWLPILATLQAFTLVTTWAVPNGVIDGPLYGLPYVLVAASVIIWLVVRALPATSPRPPASPAPLLPRLAAWWRQPRVTGWTIVFFSTLLFLRKAHALAMPQLWAEDGAVFLMQAELHGAAALTLPYMGYLHLIPRLVAQFASSALDPLWWPLFYNGVAFAGWLWAVLRLFTARFDHLPGRPWMALAIFALPHGGEVFFNITNLQWVTGVVLVQQLLATAPKTRTQRVSDITILVLIGLTGPFGLIFTPLFCVRWALQARRLEGKGLDFRRLFSAAARPQLLACLALGLCAAAQVYFLAAAPRLSTESQPFSLWPLLVVLARRLIVWPLLGHHLASSLPHGLVAAVGLVALATVVIGCCRPHPHRSLRLWTLAAFALILLAGLFRTRPDAWALDDLEVGDRYFYIPRVLFAWLLIWEFSSTPRSVGRLARFACVLTLVVHLGQYFIPSPTNYHWARYVTPIRQGVPADIPTLPENFYFEYLGRPTKR